MAQVPVPSSSDGDARPDGHLRGAPPEQASGPSSTVPPSLRPSQVIVLSDDVLHPRGRIWPPLPSTAPRRQRLVRALVRLGQGLQYHGVFRAAPAMAFHFFLSLLPLLAFIGYVLGLVARRKGVSAVIALLLDNVPSTTQAVLKEEVSHLASADRLGPLAAVGFLWIASGGTHGLMDAVESVVGAPRRAWWKQRLFSLGWVIATLAAFGVAAFGIVEWDEVVHARPAPVAVSAAPELVGQEAEASPKSPSAVAPHHAARSTRPAPPKRARKILRSGGERVLTFALSIAGALGGLCAFYRFAVTHARRVRRRVLPGAVVAVVLWIVVSWGFSLYLRTLASYTVYYGSLAAVAVLLVWLWLMSLAILVGAELNSQLEGLRDELPPESF
ncbi:MAG TPA: YihY/virulence factor BrkB family protein [Labilithrix sp.]|nr:YihY/virulence factor BrkB family protein [Labilithrix sp.]